MNVKNSDNTKLILLLSHRFPVSRGKTKKLDKNKQKCGNVILTILKIMFIMSLREDRWEYACGAF